MASIYVESDGDNSFAGIGPQNAGPLSTGAIVFDTNTILPQGSTARIVSGLYLNIWTLAYGGNKEPLSVLITRYVNGVPVILNRLWVLPPEDTKQLQFHTLNSSGTILDYRITLGGLLAAAATLQISVNSARVHS